MRLPRIHSLAQATLICSLCSSWCFAAGPRPVFRAADVSFFSGGSAEDLAPDDSLVIRGEHLRSSTTPCVESKRRTYPTYSLCGTEVRIHGTKAELSTVESNAISLRVPPDLPFSGFIDITVVVDGVESEPDRFKSAGATVRLTMPEHAYVHMPIWVGVERRHSRVVLYPHSVGLNQFGGARFEVKRNGVLLTPLEYHLSIPPAAGAQDRTLGLPGSPEGRLPLHLQYRFDVPGRYEIRYRREDERLFPEGRRTVEIERSDWVPLSVEPFAEAERIGWVRRLAASLPSDSGHLGGDAIPSLLAIPDARSLRAILPLLYHSDEVVRSIVRTSLDMFEPRLIPGALTPLIRVRGFTPELASFLFQDERGFAGGHSALLDLMPRLLASNAPLSQAGALQYLNWSRNYAWGQVPETRARVDRMILKSAEPIFVQGDEMAVHQLTITLGSVGNEESRKWLWRMIDANIDVEQAMIALCWHPHPDDLPALAKIMIESVPSERYLEGFESVAYALRNAYGKASSRFLREGFLQARAASVRGRCARELIIDDGAAGYAFLLRAVEENPERSKDLFGVLGWPQGQYRGERTPREMIDFLRRKAEGK